MDNYETVLNILMKAVQENMSNPSQEGEVPGETIPVGVSNRHLHLSQEDLDILYGPGYTLTPIKDLSQPGQYACKERLTICGPKGAIENVRILGPVRSKTQVEVLTGDSFKLGVTAPTKLSGDIEGTPGITLVGPKGSVQIKEGLIVAQRHIHMTPADAIKYGVKDGQVVDISVEGPRGGIYKNVIVRATDASALECHIDTEEANAMNVNSLSLIKIVK